MSGYYLPEEDVNNGKRNAFQMLKDIWWKINTKSGSIFKAPITRYGANGLPDGETTPEAELGWKRAADAAVNAKLDRIIKKLGA